MTVHEFLQVCRPDAYIDLWNIDVPVNSSREYWNWMEGIDEYE